MNALNHPAKLALVALLILVGVLLAPTKDTLAESIVIVSPPCHLVESNLDLVNAGRAHSNTNGNGGKAVDLAANGGIPTGPTGPLQYQACVDDVAIASIEGTVITAIDNEHNPGNKTLVGPYASST